MEIQGTGRPPDVMQCVRVGWQRLQPQIGPLIGVFAIYALIMVVLGFLGWIGWMIQIAITGPLMLGLYRVYYKAYRNESFDIGELFSGFNDFFPAFLNHLVFVVLLMVGGVLCIIPGFIVAGLGMYWPFLYDSGHKNGVEALMASKDLAMPHLWQSTLTILVLSLISVAGVLACGVGVLITGPIAMMGIMHAYETMRGSVQESNTEDSPPIVDQQ